MSEKPKCSVTDCGIKPVFTVVPMTGTLTGDWEDEDGNPSPACRSHLTDTILWMSEHYNDWHVRETS